MQATQGERHYSDTPIKVKAKTGERYGNCRLKIERFFSREPKASALKVLEGWRPDSLKGDSFTNYIAVIP